MRNSRRLGMVGLASAACVVIVAAAAWACIPVATLNASPAQVRAGEQVTLTGAEYGAKSPVVIHFNALDGPVLASITPDKDGFIRGTVGIPADVGPGNYVLVATQEAVRGETTWGVPSRTLVSVVGDAGAPVVGAPVGSGDAARPVGLERGDSSVGAGGLVLAGVGVAGVAMFVAGMTALFAGRRRAQPEAVRTTR
jgi:hypothetical protein